jgi:hypothetical protein
MKTLAAAFLKAQQEFPAVVKDASNPAYKSRYATLGAVQDAAFPVLAKYGLVIFQSVRSELLEDGRLFVRVGAALWHVESGENIAQELGMIPVKQDPQGVGSVVSYMRRYLLMTMLGLVPDDDDGNAASNNNARPAQAPSYIKSLRENTPKPPPPAHEEVPFMDGPPVWSQWGVNPQAALSWAKMNGMSDQDARDLLNTIKGRHDGKYNQQTAVAINQEFWLEVVGPEDDPPPLIDVPPTPTKRPVYP